MAKKEVKTDLWVASQLDKCKIQFTAQGSDVKEIDEALSTASKRGTGNAGYPEYVAVVNDFVIVIEDKADLDKHIKLTDTALIETTTKAITDYAVNGAYRLRRLLLLVYQGMQSITRLHLCMLTIEKDILNWKMLNHLQCSTVRISMNIT